MRERAAGGLLADHLRIDIMKVAIATDIYYPNINGISVFAQRLAIQLGKRCHDVLLIAPSLTTQNQYMVRDEVRLLGVRSLPIPLYRGYRWPGLAPGEPVERAIGQFRPDIIHLQTHFALGRAALRAGRKFGIPVMGTNHFMPENLTHHLHLPGPFEALVKKWCWRYFLRVYEDLDLLTAPTPTALDLVRKVGFPGDGRTVSNGVDLKVFNPNNKSSPHVALSLPQGPKLLYVGRLDKEKNVASAIKAFAEAAKEVDGYFVIVGSGPEANKLEQVAEKLGIARRVIFAGFVADRDLPSFYSSVDAFIMPGTAELQSIATMEAMASGLPIIALAAAALPELVKDGVNGFLLQPDDEVRLASCIATLLSDVALCRMMGRASLREIQKHNIQRTVSSFEALYAALQSEAVSRCGTGRECVLAATVGT